MSVKRTMWKILIIIIVVLATIITITLEASDIWLEKRMANNGAPLIRIVNNSQSHLYCWVSHQGGYFDFYIQAYQHSRWYYEPSGYYEWRCK